MAATTEQTDPLGTVDSVDVAAALIEEFRRVNPAWLRPSSAAPTPVPILIP